MIVFLCLFEQRTSVRYAGFAKKYFHLLKSIFAEDCELLTIVKDGKTISSVMSFYFGMKCCLIMAVVPKRPDNLPQMILCIGNLCGVVAREAVSFLILDVVNATQDHIVSRKTGVSRRSRCIMNID